MAKIFNFLKPFMCAPFVLYIFNLMAIGLDIYIPINIFSVLIIGFLKVSGLIVLVFYFAIIM